VRIGTGGLGHRPVKGLELLTSHRPLRVGPYRGKLRAYAEVRAERGCRVRCGQAAGDASTFGREQVFDSVHEELEAGCCGSRSAWPPGSAPPGWRAARMRGPRRGSSRAQPRASGRTTMRPSRRRFG
jgi:hypothetical protein